MLIQMQSRDSDRSSRGALPAGTSDSRRAEPAEERSCGSADSCANSSGPYGANAVRE